MHGNTHFRAALQRQYENGTQERCTRGAVAKELVFCYARVHRRLQAALCSVSALRHVLEHRIASICRILSLSVASPTHGGPNATHNLA